MRVACRKALKPYDEDSDDSDGIEDAGMPVTRQSFDSRDLKDVEVPKE